MRTYTLLLCLVLVGACSSILGSRELRVGFGTDRDVYQRGDAITLAVENLASETMIYDGASCAFLQRLVAAEWQQAGAIETCVFIAYPVVRIAPGEVQVATFEADLRFEAGVAYRFMIVISPDGRRSNRTPVYSNAFEIVD